MRLPDWAKLTVAFVACQLVGIVGGLITTPSLGTWYNTLVKPALMPPGWVFGPVWGVLYFLMSIAVFLVWRRGTGQEGVAQALGIFIIQMALNALWSIFFFGVHSPALACVDILLLMLFIVWTMRDFYKISRAATYLLVPYLLWVGFATYLNVFIWLRN